MPDNNSSRARRWANVIVIVMAAWAYGEAAWGPMVFSQDPQDAGADWAQIAFVVGGTLAILGLFIAQRRPPIGRAMIVVAGLLHLGVPFAYRHLAPIPMAGATLLGLLLIGAGLLAGPMPRQGMP